MGNRIGLEERKLLKAVVILAGIYLLGISAILRANFYYIDDMGRAIWGYKQFDFFGRYIPQFFTTILHADSYLTDVSPLPQFLAVVILAISAVTVLHLVTGRTTFTCIEYIATIPLCLSPYFLECLSYKYDAPYMALSILASVVPALFHKRSNLFYFASVFLGMLAVCMSYQAASGIFPMFVVLLAFLKWNDGTQWKEIVRFVLVSAAGYVAGMLFFALFLLKPEDTYVSNSVSSVSNLIPSVISHLKKYYWYVKNDFKSEWLVMIGLLCAGFLLSSVLDSKRNKWAALCLSGLVIAVFGVLAFGVYPALDKPLYDPRAMYGFGALVCFIALPIVCKRRYLLFKAVCLALCWCFFVFGFTYGNALNAQKEYTDYRISALVHDLDQLDLMDEASPKVLQLEGDIGFAPEIVNMPQDYDILNQLVPNTFGYSSSYWRGFRFFVYSGVKHIVWDDGADFTQDDLPLLKDSVFHRIYGNEQSILVELKPY